MAEASRKITSNIVYLVKEALATNASISN